MACDRPSLAGSVSQRACVFCGSRVVLYPIADAIHLVHGPIGCAAYTWDIRRSFQRPQLHRNSFSTDLQELDVIYGGEKKLEAALMELIAIHHPNAAFVYSTCIVGIIGDDVGAVCGAFRKGPAYRCCRSFGGFKAPSAMATGRLRSTLPVDGRRDTQGIGPSASISWATSTSPRNLDHSDYLKKIGIDVVACVTGDARIADIARLHGRS
jgi:nitrogenase molybdenum-cofactor synthesis protein NifE